MSRTDLMRGTLDLLILRALMGGSNHGLGIARRVEQLTQGAFRVNPGSLFPALHRLEQKGWLTAEWGRSETNRKAKFYELTPPGAGTPRRKPATGSASRSRSSWRCATSRWRDVREGHPLRVAAGDDRPAAPPVVVLSHRLWQGVYGADPSVLGSTLVVEGCTRSR